MAYPATIDEICAALRERGWPALARRLAYFASADDLEPGDVPLTAASALGFWAFFSRVAAAAPLNRIDLACSPEGRLSAYWDYAHGGRVSVWFHDTERVNFAAKDAGKQWVDLDGGGDTGSQSEVVTKLVAAGLFQWHQEIAAGKNWRANTTLPDTAGVGT